ncbi:MAG: hypothetical protein WC799_17705 [Desulfobacteraceae bacterium]
MKHIDIGTFMINWCSLLFPNANGNMETIREAKGPMKQAAGSTGSGTSFCLFCISW